MDKTIESKFFEAFMCGGVVDKCIDWMIHTYHLPPTKPRVSSKDDKQPQNEELERYYRKTLPKEILEATAAFDDSVIMFIDSPLMDEIEANLNECQTDAQRERYLFSLLKPFGENQSGCGIARIYNPTAEINQLNEAIRECEKNKAIWEDEQLKDVNGEPSGTPKEQIEACNNKIERYREQIKWVLNVNHQFIDLTCTDKDKEGTIERCLSDFVGVMIMYANRLDALLLTYGIDLMRLQRESGLYLKAQRLITDVDSYIGSRELTQRYIDALPKEPQQAAQGQQMGINEPQQQKTLQDLLPEQLKTDEALKLFQGAIDAKMIEKTATGLKWHFSNALLAYLCGIVYCGDTKQWDGYYKEYSVKRGSTFFPETELNRLFGVKNLGQSRLQLTSLPRGYEKVDNLLDRGCK